MTDHPVRGLPSIAFVMRLRFPPRAVERHLRVVANGLFLRKPKTRANLGMPTGIFRRPSSLSAAHTRVVTEKTVWPHLVIRSRLPVGAFYNPADVKSCGFFFFFGLIGADSDRSGLHAWWLVFRSHALFHFDRLAPYLVGKSYET